MSKGPWYSDGLRFTCTMCGKCCTGEPGWVWVDEEDLAAIAKFRDESVKEVRAIYTLKGPRGLSLREKPNGDCVFYDRKKGCVIYPVRPKQCRTWPFWDSNLVDEASWERTCEVCPGSGKGELISAEEITRRARVIRI
jgi:Fe-S-cluster containining protein